MSGTAVLAFCYFYLYHQDKKQFLKIWAISWSIYFTRYIFMLAIVLWKKTPFLLFCNQSASLISGVLLLYGSYLFVNKKFPRSLYYLTALGLFWIVISTAYNFSFMLMSLPTFSFLAGIYIWTGILFLKSKESYQMESRAVGLAFIIWGAHKANYPFLRPVLWFAPWGYLIAAILEFMVALGLLMVYFRKTKDELHSNEMKLKENQKRLVSAQRIAKVGDWSWDLETNELIWSEETFRIFGQNPETFETSVEAFEEAIHPDDYHDFIAKRDFALSNNKDIDIEHRIVLPGGSIRYVHEITTTIKNSQGEVIKALGTVQDISERKLFDIELANTKEMFETMFNTIPDGVVITNTNRKIQLANKGMETTFGYKPEEIIGKETKFLYAAQDKFEQTGKNVFGKDAKNPGDLYITRYIDKNGREFSGETFGAKLYDEHIRWIGNLGIMRDITEREQAEFRIQQAQKMESIGNLAGGIAHDFNNILFPIVGLAEMLAEDLPSDSPEKENAKEILIAGRRGVELVQQILAFSRQHEHKLSPTRLQFVIKEVLKLTRSTIPTNIEIKKFLQPDCGLILADSTQIHQIGMNLITNAYHAVQDNKGTINVEVKEIEIKKTTNNTSLPPGKYATLTVTDNGVGIPNEILDKIFEPYFTTKKQGKGTGLGLSVVYGIVKKHNGEIKVMSEPGKGTSILIYLPVMISSVSKNAAESTSLLPTGTEHILLVDDELPITKLEKQLLERLGYKIDPHTSSPDALDAFRKNPDKYDLIISDMSMPQMTGKDLAEELLKIRPDIRIIICTGFSERFNEEQAHAMGIRGFLMKPVVMADLAKEVRRVLDKD